MSSTSRPPRGPHDDGAPLRAVRGLEAPSFGASRGTLARAMGSVFAMTTLLVPAPLLAEPPTAAAEGPDEWERLFDRGREKMATPASLDEGCRLLEQSYELQKRGDTLLNLAECHRRQGKTATAWREFDEAIKYAQEVEFTEAIKAAEGLRDHLATMLSRLRVDVPSSKLPDLKVWLDGKELPSAQWGEPLFVDPGPHAIRATAAEHSPFEKKVEVKPLGGEEAVVVVSLQPVAKPPPLPPPPPPPEEDGFPLWTFAVTGGASALALGLSVGFGVDTVAANDELDEACGGEARRACPASLDFLGLREREERSFGLFVGLGVAGLAGAAASAIGLGVALGARGEPPEGSVSLIPLADPSGGGLLVGGTF
jgi:hypothetical protein